MQGMTSAIVALATVASISSAAADARNITADGFLEMNGTYRAGLVHGALASMFVLGVDEKYTGSLEEGVRCQGQRKATVEQTSIDFAKYIEEHPDTKQAHNVFLLKNAIFMPSAMKAKFTAIGDLAWDALMEHKINHEMKTWKERPRLQKFEKLGDDMLLELETEIQKRLWSDVSAA